LLIYCGERGTAVHSRKNWLSIIVILFLLFPEELLAEESDIWIFVSFSMPEQSLRQWIKQANEFGATVVIRGFHKNSLQESIKKISVLLPEGSEGIQINPLLFEELNIQAVPTVVRGQDSVIGDVGLAEALEVMKA